MKERDLHRAVAAYLDAALPKDAYWTTIPGGDGRATRAPGYKPGCPDLLVAWNGITVLIELKTERGRLSDAQKETFEQIFLAGLRGGVCRSVDEVFASLKTFGIPLKSRIAA